MRRQNQNYFGNSGVNGLPSISIINRNNININGKEHKDFSLIYLYFNDWEIDEIKSKINDLLRIENIYKLDLGETIMEEIKNTRINVDLIITSFNLSFPGNTKFRLVIKNPRSISLFNSSMSFSH